MVSPEGWSGVYLNGNVKGKISEKKTVLLKELLFPCKSSFFHQEFCCIDHKRLVRGSFIRKYEWKGFRKSGGLSSGGSPIRGSTDQVLGIRMRPGVPELYELLSKL